MKKKIFFILFLIFALLSCPIQENKITIDESSLNDESFLPLQFESLKANSSSKATVILNFNKNIDFTSLKKENISVVEEVTKTSIENFALKSIGIEETSKRFAIAFTEDLQENKKYLISISAVSDLYQQTISVSTNFWTGFFTPIEYTTPEDFETFSNDNNVVVQFKADDELNATTVTADNIFVEKVSDGTKPTLIDFNYDTDSKRVTFAIQSVENAEYYLKITDNVQYPDSKKIVPLTVQFTAKEKGVVASIQPAQESSFRPTLSEVVVQFDTTIELDVASVNTSTVFIESEEHTPIPTQSFNFDNHSRSCTLTFVPNSFKTGKKYLIKATSGVLFKNKAQTKAFKAPIFCFEGDLLDLYKIGNNFNQFAMKQPTFGDVPSDSNYVYVFLEEFDTSHTVGIQRHDTAGTIYKHTSAPDPSKWEVIADHWGNGWYIPEQVSVHDGRLYVSAEQKSGTINLRPGLQPQNYTRVAGRVQTKQHFGFLYGKFYVKFKPSEPATWPAIWLLANSERPKDEMDFIEYYPHQSARKWDSVYWAGSDWIDAENSFDRVYNWGKDVGLAIYNHDVEATMTWDEQTGDNSKLGVEASFFTRGSNPSKVKDEIILNYQNMGTRYMRPVYPIIEIQLNRLVTDGHWNSNNPTTPKVMEVDYVRVAQKKDHRYATVLEEFVTLDNVAATPGIRKANFNYPNVEGINYGYFTYGGQPFYETDLVIVDEAYKNEPQSLIFKVKNVKDVFLLVYFENSTGMQKSNPRPRLDKTTGLSSTPIDSYAVNPNLDFFLEVAPSSAGPWTPMPFDARWNGRDDASVSSYVENGLVIPEVCAAKNYEKHGLPSNTYNYVKVKFPNVGDNWNKILLSKVVFTRYEGTNYDSYKIEGEE